MPVPEGISARLLQSQEDERWRVAHELHDDISQQVALIAIGVDKLRQEMAAIHPDASSRLAEMLEQAQALGENVRRLSHELYPTNLEHLGLCAALRTLCTDFSARHGIGVDLRCEAMPAGIPIDVAGALFRVVQEGLRNVARHSGATSAIVEIVEIVEAVEADESAASAESPASAGAEREHGVRLTVEDQGRGFDLDAAWTSGVGLASMRERLAALGGHCAIRTAPSGGTRIDATVPLARPDAGAHSSRSTRTRGSSPK